jgi:hypothetical protein
MSHDHLQSEPVLSRRLVLGGGLLALAGTILGLGASAAQAQVGARSNPSRSSPGLGKTPGGGGDGDVILPGTPGNCPPGQTCGDGQQKAMMLIKPKPEDRKPPRKHRRRRPTSCGRRPDGTIDRSCRNPD